MSADETVGPPTLGSDTSSHIPSFLSIQVNNLDTYQARPSNLDVISDVPSVPVIRVFGTTTTGHTATIHVHGVYPYFYIEYCEKEDRVKDYISSFHSTLTAAMNSAFRRDPKSPARFIADISVCKAVPFYGFHVGWRLFLRVSLLNPSHMFKCTDLLRSGSVFGTPFQLYEAHIPYFMQFFADFNLYGCGILRICDGVFRGDAAKIVSLTAQKCSQIHEIRTSKLPPLSFSQIELDISAAWIDNRLDLDQFDIHTDLSLEHSVPKDHKYLSSMRALWREDELRRAQKGLAPYTKPPNRPTPPHVPWSNEISLWQSFAQTVSEVSVSNFKDTYDGIETMFETVTRLCVPRPSNVRAAINHSVTLSTTRTNSVHTNSESSIQNVQQINGQPSSLARRTNLSSLRAEQAHPTNVATLSETSFLTSSIRDDSERSMSFSYYSSEYDKLKDQAAKYLSQSHVSDAKTSCRPNEIQIRRSPPTSSYVEQSFNDFGLPTVVYCAPHYSDPKDQIKTVASPEGFARVVKTQELPVFDFETVSDLGYLDIVPTQSSHDLEYSARPPSFSDVVHWLTAETSMGENFDEQHNLFQSQIQFATQQRLFRYETQSPPKRLYQRTRRDMSILTMELHANCEEKMMPDPNSNQIEAVFWQYSDDMENLSQARDSGVIILSDSCSLEESAVLSITHGCEVAVAASELDLIALLVRKVRTLDPDILAGLEVHAASWGYLIERVAVIQEAELEREEQSQDSTNAALPAYLQEVLEFDILDQLSRIREKSSGKMGDSWGFTHATGYKIAGRHVLNVWRTLRSGLQLTQYTLENIVFQVLHERIPHYSFDDLTRLFNGTAHEKSIVLHYCISRVGYIMQLIHNQELITRFSEEARLLGIDYYSVLSRGSQFKVESLLCRLTRSENYMLISPTKKQVGSQNALEYIPLVMEPESGFYTSPVLVLDFQSLYPSIVIAYNYCYSTCLGRASLFRGKNKLGVLGDLRVDEDLLQIASKFGEANTEELFNMAPNGLIFVKQSVRKSVLAKMLTDILDTRVVVKAAMQDGDTNYRHMNNRQLALKLIANVTYGYTSATYSGRMPCAEIADSIVVTAREILERTIQKINNHKDWNAHVIYGDTDSIFVHAHGRSKAEAFDLGDAIADTISNEYPSPIKLKFEKVYMGTILQTKKRYVGYMYESRSQNEPVFDAKGIETVRRDGTPMQQKVEEKALRILFETNDLSQVKHYFQAQCTKILMGKVSIQDLCFAKEVRLGTYKDEDRLPPGALLAAKKAERDERAQPHYRERVPYVVIAGGPNDRLMDRCVDPEFLVQNLHANYDSEYYIRKNLIPALARIFDMIGANVESWYDEMDKSRLLHRTMGVQSHSGGHQDNGLAIRHTINQYYHSSKCLACRQKPYAETLYQQLNVRLCMSCWSSPPSAIYEMQARTSKLEADFRDMQIICRACSSLTPTDRVLCVSKDCPIYYSRKKVEEKLVEQESVIQQYLNLDW